MRTQSRQIAMTLMALILFALVPFAIWLGYLAGVIRPFKWAFRWF